MRIIDWYMKLPRPHRSRAIANCDTPDKEVDSLSEAIYQGMEWATTPQGYHYWRDVYNVKY